MNQLYYMYIESFILQIQIIIDVFKFTLSIFFNYIIFNNHLTDLNKLEHHCQYLQNKMHTLARKHMPLLHNIM